MRVIALVLDPHGEILDFAGSMVSGFADVVRETRFHLNLTQYQLGEDPMTPIHHIVRNRLADGVVFARTEPRDPRVEYLLDAGFPFVTHGRTDIGPHAWYDYDNAAFAELAVDRLVSIGRQRILIIPPADQYSFSGHMKQGFNRAIDRAGIEGIIPTAFDLNTSSAETYQHLIKMLKGETSPDGFVCPGEIAAMASMAAIMDVGLELRRDVDVVAKQTSTIFDLHRSKIETIAEDIEDAGRCMAQALLDQINGASPAQLQTLQMPKAKF